MAQWHRTQASLVIEEQEIVMSYQYLQAQTIWTRRAFQGKKREKNLAKGLILNLTEFTILLSDFLAEGECPDTMMVYFKISQERTEIWLSIFCDLVSLRSPYTFQTP